MVYENLEGETYAKIDDKFKLYAVDVDIGILQTSKLVAQEARSIVEHRRHDDFGPTTSIVDLRHGTKMDKGIRITAFMF
jgi:hypothetical protein